MKIAFPNADVKAFEQLITEVDLPDLDDRHVLAAAIKCKAHLILTYNLRDFPLSKTHKLGINVQCPDIFIMGLIDQCSNEVIKALKKLQRQIKKSSQVEYGGN